MHRGRCSIQRSAALIALVALLAGSPTAALTPFLCIDSLGHPRLEFGIDLTNCDGIDEPGNQDEGDVSPWDDPPADAAPVSCRDVALQLHQAITHVSQNADCRPLAYNGVILQPGPGVLWSASTGSATPSRSAFESPPRSTTTQLRI